MRKPAPDRKAPVPQSQSGKERPVHTIRHRNIKASIWRNSTGKGPVYNVTIVRGFKVGPTWKDSSSFGYDDLPIVAKLLNDCHSYITDLRAQGRADGSGEASE